MECVNLATDYKTVEKMGVGDPKAYLLSRFAGAVALRQHILAAHTAQQTDEALCEGVQSTGWSSVVPLLPFLSHSDASSALESCVSAQQLVKKGEASVLADVYVVGKDLIDRALRLLEERYTEKLRAAGPAAAGSLSSSAGDASAASETSEGGKKKKGGGATFSAIHCYITMRY